MTSSTDRALGAKREIGFWVAGGSAVLLCCLSYINRPIAAFFNHHLFHGEGAAGWWLYLAIRLPITGLLVWTVMHFPNRQEQVDGLVKRPQGIRAFDPLLGLRSLACLFVLMGHYFIVVFPLAAQTNPWVRVLLSAPPWCGVWIFFTLSGYLMGKGFARGRYSLDEAGCKLFLRNRMLRIVPIYICALLLVSLYRYTPILQWRNWWMLLEMLIFDYKGELPINPIGALWSVSTEVQFYLLVPLLMVILLRIRKLTGRAFFVAPLMLLCLGTTIRSIIVHSHVSEGRYSIAPLLTNLDLFLAGMSVNLMPISKVSEGVRRRLGGLLLAIAMGFYVTISAIFLYPVPLHLRNFSVIAPMLCALFAAIFIYMAELRGAIAIRKGWIGRFQIGVQTMGILTYCLYVFHPEVYLVNTVLVPAAHSLWASLEYFPMVMLELFAVASFFYFAVEKPFDSKKRVSGTALEDAP